MMSKLLVLGLLNVGVALKPDWWIEWDWNDWDWFDKVLCEDRLDVGDLCFLPSGEARDFPTPSFAAAVAASTARGGADDVERLRRCRSRAAEAHSEVSAHLAEAQGSAITLGVSLYDHLTTQIGYGDRRQMLSLYDHLMPAGCAPSWCGSASYSGDGDAPVRDACCGDGPKPIGACRDALQRKHDDLDSALGAAFDELMPHYPWTPPSAKKVRKGMLRGSTETIEAPSVGDKDVAGDYVDQTGGDEGIVVGNPADEGTIVGNPGVASGTWGGNPTKTGAAGDGSVPEARGVMSGNPGFLAKVEAASALLEAHRRVRLDLDGLASSYAGDPESPRAGVVCEDPEFLRYYAEVAASPLAETHACLRSLLDEATAHLVAMLMPTWPPIGAPPDSLIGVVWGGGAEGVAAPAPSPEDVSVSDEEA